MRTHAVPSSLVLRVFRLLAVLELGSTRLVSSQVMRPVSKSSLKRDRQLHASSFHRAWCVSISWLQIVMAFVMQPQAISFLEKATIGVRQCHSQSVRTMGKVLSPVWQVVQKYLRDKFPVDEDVVLAVHTHTLVHPSASWTGSMELLFMTSGSTPLVPLLFTCPLTRFLVTLRKHLRNLQSKPSKPVPMLCCASLPFLPCTR